MDTALAVAIAGGIFGTVGTIGNVIDHVTARRSTSRADDGRLDLERDIQSSADMRWMIGELKDERVALKAQIEALTARIKDLTDEQVEKMATIRTDHETLQRLYREALDRIESLENDE